MTRIGPVERIRTRLADRLSDIERRSIPEGYQRLGPVVIVRLPENLRPTFPDIGEAYRAELGVATVLRRGGPVHGEYRLPDVERIAGDRTEAEVREGGVVYRLDAARVMFAAGNRTERHRLVREVRPGERIADLFAGIGYFTLPIAVHTEVAHVDACEANPVSFGYLRENVRRNRVEDRVAPHLGPNESTRLAAGSFDRVILGFLPSSLPWIGRAVGLLRADGGTLHVHLVAGTRDGTAATEGLVRAAIERARGRAVHLAGREVKPYGPGRVHVVVDAATIPPSP